MVTRARHIARKPEFFHELVSTAFPLNLLDAVLAKSVPDDNQLAELLFGIEAPGRDEIATLFSRKIEPDHSEQECACVVENVGRPLRLEVSACRVLESRHGREVSL